MLNAIKKSLGNSKPNSPVVRPAAYTEDDLESNTSSIGSSASSSTYYSTFTHLSETSDAFERQSTNSNTDEETACVKDTSMRQLVEDSSMLDRLRHITLNLDRRKKYAESFALLNEYREAATHFLPAGHVHGQKILNYLADHYIARKMFSMAESCLIECCEKKDDALGIPHPSTIKSKIKLAAVLHLQNNSESCELYLSDCMSACINASMPHVSIDFDFSFLCLFLIQLQAKLAVEVSQSLCCVYCDKGEFLIQVADVVLKPETQGVMKKLRRWQRHAQKCTMTKILQHV
jgi:hypothetical protein